MELLKEKRNTTKNSIRVNNYRRSQSLSLALTLALTQHKSVALAIQYQTNSIFLYLIHGAWYSCPILVNKCLSFFLKLSIYAKYHSPEQTVRDNSLRAQAICDEELKKDYFINLHVQVFMIFTLLLPFFFIVVLLIFIRSRHKEINKELILKRNHGVFAAMITIGVVVQAVIVVINAAAVTRVLTKQYEFHQYDLQHTVNFFMTFITFSFNATIGLIMVLCLLYLWCTLCHRDAKTNCESCATCPTICLEDCLACCLIPLVFGITGKRQDTAWKMPKSYDNDASDQKPEFVTRRTAWVLVVMLVSPLFSLASHGGYILAAWFTGPSQATETALMLVAALIYASFVLSHSYTANSNVQFKSRCWSIWIPLYFIWQGPRFIICKCFRQNVCCFKISIQGQEMANLLKGERTEDSNKTLNISALCIVLGWSTVVIGSISFTFVVFNEVPFQILDLAMTDLVNIFQVLIIAIAALITYKILTFGEPEIYRFIKKVRKAYEEKTKPEKDIFDDLEAVGIITGNALDAIIVKK